MRCAIWGSAQTPGLLTRCTIWGSAPDPGLLTGRRPYLGLRPGPPAC